MARYETATTIINNAAKELGLWTATVADPYSGANPLAAQLCALLNRCGRSLAMMDWPQLVCEYSITGDGTTTAFDLPSDFLSLVSNASFDRTSGFVVAPISAQGWQQLKATSLGATVGPMARILQSRTGQATDQIVFMTAPANGDSIVFEYRSRNWLNLSRLEFGDMARTDTNPCEATASASGTPTAIPTNPEIWITSTVDPIFSLNVMYDSFNQETQVLGSGIGTQNVTLASAPGLVGCVISLVSAGVESECQWSLPIHYAYGDKPEAYGDTVLFDPALMVASLKLAWKREKGFDTTTAEQDYLEALEACRGDLLMAGTLSLTGGSDVHLVDGCNLPGVYVP